MKSRVLFALVHMLLIWVFHLKSCVIVTPMYLMEFFEDTLYCIWLAEISYPIFLPNILIYPRYILLKFQWVLCSSHFTIANTVIGERSYFWVSICGNIINVQREQQWIKNGPLWDTWQNWSPLRNFTVYNSSLCSITKKGIYPPECLSANAITK